MTKFLDYNGLSYFWEKIKAWVPFLSKKSQSIPFGQVDSTSTSTVFTATVDGITELRDGVFMYLRNGVVNSAEGFTININGLGAKPVYQNIADGTRVNVGFKKEKTFLFAYNSTRVEGGCWDVYYGVGSAESDTNSVGYQLRTNSGTLPAKFKTYRYRLLFTSSDGNYFVGANADTTTNATAVKTPTTEKIDPFGEIVFYNSTTIVNENANFNTTALWQQYPFSLGYSFNTTGVALVLDYPKPVYIKCTPQTDGSAIIDATTPYVQSLPSTEDGKIYIYLGIAYAATSIELHMNHPVYYYKDGAIRQWTNQAQQTVPEYTISDEATPTQGYQKTYKLKKDGADISGSDAINLPYTNAVLTVDDITQLTSEQVDSLNVGDIVVESVDESFDDGGVLYTDIYEHAYIVASKDVDGEGDEVAGSLVLINTKARNSFRVGEMVYHEYFLENDTWTYDRGETIPIWLTDIHWARPGAVFSGCVNRFNTITQNCTMVWEDYQSNTDITQITRIVFDIGSTVPTITWPSQIWHWKGGSAPTLKANTYYAIDIVNNFAVCYSTDDDTPDISGKADKVANATNGNFAGLDATGNLTDSGYSASDFVSASSLPSYTIARLGTPETGYFASYVLQKDGVQEGATINIPKDYLVKSGSVIDVVEYNGQYYDATDTSHTTPLPVTAAGKYLDFVVNTVDSSGTTSHIYIAVNDLVDAYTEGNGIDISNLNVVSVQIDSSNSNGLSVSSNGLALATAVASSGGTGGSNGAMTAADKEKLNGLRKMVVLEYGVSTWSDFQNAFNDNAVVYCKASSNSNPATGDKRRYAFLAYNGGTSVEFQYYRSVSSHSSTQQGDQVFVYKLTNANAWSVETREAYTKIVAGTNLTSSYSNGALTINAGAISDKADKVQNATSGNFAGLDSSGNLTDSGSKASDFATASQGVPSGGTTGQVLAKHSNTDNDLEWTDPSGGSSFAFEIVGNNLQVTYGDAQNPNFSITNNHLIVTL